MFKIKLATAALIAVSSVGVVAQGSAIGAPAEWMLNKKTLAEEGLTTVSLGAVAKTDKASILSSAGLTVECLGTLESKKAEIVKSNIAKAEALIFTGCAATTPATCTVPTTIGTVPVEGEGTLDGSLAIKAIIHPHTGKVFTTLVVSGTECAAAGSKPVTGDAEVLAPEGQDERTEQLLEEKQGSTGLLKLGSESASLSGSALVALASCAAWSLL